MRKEGILDRLQGILRGRKELAICLIYDSDRPLTLIINPDHPQISSDPLRTTILKRLMQKSPAVRELEQAVAQPFDPNQIDGIVLWESPYIADIQDYRNRRAVMTDL